MSPRISIRLLPSQTDGRLVELAGRGHERAFETLVHRYRRPLLRYCRRLGLSDARSEDVLQHSMTKAWLALSEGREVRELRPWLYRIVHNDAVNTVLRAPAEHDQLTDALPSSSSSENALEGRIEAREALAQVASLPQMQRHAIVLTAIEGRSHHETARALGISDGAVRGLLHRARTTLRSAAAMVFPPALLRWPARWSASGSLGERTTELSLGGGAVGATGLLLKGAAFTATVGLFALGTNAVHSGGRTQHLSRPHTHRAAVGYRAANTDQAATSASATTELALIKSNGRARGHGGERRTARHGRRRGGLGPAGAPISPAHPSVEQPPSVGSGGDQDGSGQGEGGHNEAVEEGSNRGRDGDRIQGDHRGNGTDQTGSEDQAGRVGGGHESDPGSIEQAGEADQGGPSAANVSSSEGGNGSGDISEPSSGSGSGSGRSAGESGSAGGSGEMPGKIADQDGGGRSSDESEASGGGPSHGG